MEKIHRLILFAILVSWLIYMAIIESRWKLEIHFAEIQEHPIQTHVHNITQLTEDQTCLLYIAPTTLPFEGYGIFTTRSFDIDQLVAPPDSPSIPLIDIYSKNSHRRDWLPLFNTYIWSDGQASSDLSFEALQVPDAHMTLGMFPNHHSFLKSISYMYPTEPYDDTLAQTYYIHNKPSSLQTMHLPTLNAGAISYHSGRTFTSSRKIEAGEELFIYYGNRFLDSRPSLDSVPRRRDFYDAAAILSTSLHTFNLTSWSTEEIFDTSHLESVIYFMNQVLNQTATNVARTASLLPKTPTELTRVIHTANKLQSDTNITDVLEVALAKEISIQKKSVEWIVEHGHCLDNIFSQISWIPGAGRGAFAKRKIHARATIVHTPMLQILHKDALVLHQVDVDRYGVFTRNDQITIGKQLLINYCFGHSQSNLLLCPTTNSMLINHCRKGDEYCGEPNAYFQWSNDSNTNAWRKMSLEEMSKRQGRGLSMDFIALRDIEAGEEIFIDYGPGWVDAWRHHEKSWSKRNFSPVASSTMLNKLNEPIPTGEKIDSLDMIPSDLFTGCFFKDDPDWRPKAGYSLNWTDWADDDILTYFGEDGSHFQEGNKAFTDFWPCLVLKRGKDESGKDLYTVRIFHPSKPNVYTWWHGNDIPRFLYNFPRESIRYFHKPYHSDLFLEGAFRHFIPIPDGMFPQLWRDDSILQEGDSDPSRIQRIFPTCKFRPGDDVQVLLGDEDDWMNATVHYWCNNTNQYYVSLVREDDITREVSLGHIRWSSSKRLGSSNWHPYF